MKTRNLLLTALLAIFSVAGLHAESALSVLGKDYSFPKKVDGLPQKLSDFSDLRINFFTTSDGVKLAYWEAGSGKPLIILPGWSSNGAEYINVMYLLRSHYHIYVLDPRNQGLSARTDNGMRVARFAMDLREFNHHIGVKSAYYCGHSMGAAILWSYVDLFGTQGMEKLVFIDEPPSILAHPDWSAEMRANAGAMAARPQEVIDLFISGKPSAFLAQLMKMDSPYFENSQTFANTIIHNDMKYLPLIMFDHTSQDWRDVIGHKINVPVAVFTGDYSPNLPSQHWMHSVMPTSRLYIFTRAEFGDHLLAYKNPVKFTTELCDFLR